VWNAVVHAKGLGPIASKSLLSYLGHFAFGMLVALWIERRRLRVGTGVLRASSTALLMAAGVGLVAVNAVAYEMLSGSSAERIVLAKLPTALGFALVIAAAAAGAGPAVRWLRSRVLVGIGVISYGVYLWHLPLLLAVRKVGLLPASLGLRWLVVLALALGAAALSWFRVEKPLIERAAGPRRQAPQALRPAEAQAAP